MSEHRRLSAVAVFLAGFLPIVATGCSSSALSPTARPERPPRETASEADSALESRALLLLLSDRRMFDATSFELMLGEPPPIREVLAMTLGRIGDPRGRSLLQGLLVDSEPEVRQAAAFALGELGSDDARRALIVASVDDDPEVGALAVEALGKLGAPLADVRRALGALEPPAGARRLAPFLFLFKEVAAVGVAKELLVDPDPEVRRGGIYALGREARAEGLGPLRELVAGEDPYGRAWAARGLGAVGELEDLGRLQALLDDDSASVRIQALRSGGRILGRAEALPPIGWGDRLGRLVRDPEPGIRAAALEVGGSFLPHPQLEASLRRVWSDGEPRERELALLALVAGGVADAGELAEAAALSGDRWLRARAAEAAGTLGGSELLGRLIHDGEPLVRATALGGLAELGERAPLIAALDDSDPVVRATALDALALAPELTTGEVVRAIDRAVADGADNDVRRTGIDVLLRRATERPAEDRPAVIEALERLASDDDWLIRRTAAGALAELDEPRPDIGPVETGRSLEAYRRIVRQTSRPRSVELQTERGNLLLELACPEAPMTCLSFLQLVRLGFFDGNRIHRVVPDFVVQGGDPRGDGWGGPGYALRDEINRLRYRRGTLGMALSGPDTGGSQFFVALAPQPHLDGGYTVFGRLVAGDEVLDRLRQGDRIVAARELEGADSRPVR
jgi:cyclophilin family peptidyl-prolyl cis-trans isomerase/HEAT repeat protein